MTDGALPPGRVAKQLWCHGNAVTGLAEARRTIGASVVRAWPVVDILVGPVLLLDFFLFPSYDLAKPWAQLLILNTILSNCIKGHTSLVSTRSATHL